MGSALSVAGWLGVATVILIIMAILALVATNRVKNITGFSTNTNLSTAHSRLVWGQVFAWIAAALALILLLGYIVLHFLNTSEWLHVILWILLFAALITSGVFLALALSEIDKLNSNIDNNGAKSYIWGALIAGIIALIVLLISGGWRAVTRGYYPETYPTNQYWMAANPDIAEFPPQMVQPQMQPQMAPQLQVSTVPGAYNAPI